MLLVHRLLRDAETLGDLSPREAGCKRSLDLEPLERLQPSSQRGDRREPLSRRLRVGRGEREIDRRIAHFSDCSPARGFVNGN